MVYKYIKENLNSFSFNNDKFKSNLEKQSFNILYNLFIVILNFCEFIKSIYYDLKKYIPRKSLDNVIYNIDHIDYNINNKIINIYCLTFLNKLFLLIKNNNVPYNLDKHTTNNIKNLIKIKEPGYLKISFNDNEKEKEILLNLSILKNNNYLFKHTDILVRSLIENFIKNEVIHSDKDLLYIELKYKDKNTEKSKDITKLFKHFKNSFKLDNINVRNLILLLHLNIFNKSTINDFDLKKINNFSLIITNDNLDEIIYNVNDFINLETFYEKLAVQDE